MENTCNSRVSEADKRIAEMENTCNSRVSEADKRIAEMENTCAARVAEAQASGINAIQEVQRQKDDLE